MAGKSLAVALPMRSAPALHRPRSYMIRCTYRAMICLCSGDSAFLIYCGDVHAGTIIRSIGNPNAVPRWQWRCGFYPGSGPGECTVGTAASFEAARSAFEATWRVFLAKRAEADFQKSRDDWDWTAQKYRRFDPGERMPACGLPQGANVN
jgi:hypothetical protein